MDEGMKVVLDKISIKTGLKVETIQDLLRTGWTYTEKLDESDCWVKDNVWKYKLSPQQRVLDEYEDAIRAALETPDEVWRKANPLYPKRINLKGG